MFFYHLWLGWLWLCIDESRAIAKVARLELTYLRHAETVEQNPWKLAYEAIQRAQHECWRQTYQTWNIFNIFNSFDCSSYKGTGTTWKVQGGTWRHQIHQLLWHIWAVFSGGKATGVMSRLGHADLWRFGSGARSFGPAEPGAGEEGSPEASQILPNFDAEFPLWSRMHWLLRIHVWRS